MEKETERLRSAAGEGGKVVFARLLPGCDLVEGVERICKENAIEGGSLSCLGSLREAVLLNPSPRKEGKIVPGYGPPIRIPGPIQVLCCQGTIGKSEHHERVVHIHGVVCNDKHEVYGGHFAKGENIVSVTMEVIINGVKGIKVVRKYDPEVEEVHLSPEKA